MTAGEAAMDRPHNVFVFGTLKRGFPLHEGYLVHAIFAGLYRTIDRYPMMIAGARFAPMIINERGMGRRVRGELYRVTTEELSRLDKIESVGEPGNLRIQIPVEPLHGGERVNAEAFFKSWDLAAPIHSDWLEVYEHDPRFVAPTRD